VEHDTGLYAFHLFAGCGGGVLADILLGHRTVGAVEIEGYRRGILLQRQLDGCLPRFPVWDDVRTLRLDNPDTASYMRRLRGVRRELAICGGFP
jgi:DNA (cytosine-5)-methyltransferase 1